MTSARHDVRCVKRVRDLLGAPYAQNTRPLIFLFA